VISKFSLKRFRNAAVKRGYDKSVVDDEMHAFALTGWAQWCKPTKEMKAFRKALKVVEKGYGNFLGVGK